MGSWRSLAVGAQFAALAAAWGSSFLFIKVGLQGVSPAQVVVGRLGVGALTLACVLVFGGRRTVPPMRVWGHMTVVALMLCVAPFLLFGYAEQHVSSGLASIYNATTPLMTMAVAMLALTDERPNARRLAGMAIGLLGVLVVLGPWRGLGGGSAMAQLACLAATACYGVGFVWLRRFISPYGLPALTIAAMQVGIGAVIALILTALLPAHPIEATPSVVGSIAALGALGTGLAYVWNTNVINAWGATTASTVTYLTPVVGVTLGVVILSERLTWNQPIGAVLVVVGIIVTRTAGATKASDRPSAMSAAHSSSAPK
ncbi:DMT family transporter [Mycolicibacterium mucogenicum]|nr:DMT family transporter [Mycolicibacterium mucogenicum]